MGTTAREKVLKCIGVFPQKPTNLNIEVESKPFVIKEQCNIFRVWYNVEDNERVLAYLLKPRTVSTPTGCILALHQHGGEFDVGKSEPAGLGGAEINHYGPRLCELGFSVLCPDFLCFEDRRPSLEVRQRNGGRMEGQGYEYHEFFARLLHGSTLQAKYLHDMSVALDVIEQLPGIDSSRIATLGHSLGGQEAIWITWYDSRIKAAVSSCGLGVIQEVVDNYIVHNKALYLPGFLSEVGDMDVILSEISDRHVFISNGSEDILFPKNGVKRLMADLKLQGKNVECVLFNGGHQFGPEIQQQAYDFLQRAFRT
jgi:dienelactone hydrolase